MSFTTRFLRDEEVNEELDRQLRALLLECFPREAHHLETKRYFHECPRNRWFAFAENGELAAHIAAHEKVIAAGERELRILGIAEVCVAPQFRGQGLVKALLKDVHQWGREQEFAFSVLMGARKIYSSSGYVNASNAFTLRDVKTGQNKTEVLGYFMFLPLGDEGWPEGEIDLRGPSF